MSAIDPRPPISAQAKQLLVEAFAQVPPGKRGALVVFADGHGARAHLAAPVGDNGAWKIALTGGVTYHGAITGQVAIVGTW